jgi:hypothetical protein
MGQIYKDMDLVFLITKTQIKKSIHNPSIIQNRVQHPELICSLD